MKAAETFVKKNKPKIKKEGASTFMEAYDYRNKKMVWFVVNKNSTIDQYPAGLKFTNRSSKNNTISYKILLKPKNKSSYDKKTKITTTWKYTVKYNIKGTNKKVYIVNKTSVKETVTKRYNKYLATTTNTEVNNARIVQLAKDITKDYNSNDYYGKAQAIYKWVQNNTDYSTNAPMSAVAVLSSNNKDLNGHYKAYCIGSSNLVAALCRAAGIPVRFQAKFHYDAYKQVPFASQLHVAHVWSEVYVKGTWLYADAAKSWGSIYDLNYETSLIKPKTANGGTYITHDNKWNYWSFNCNCLWGVHQDSNIKRSEIPFSIFEHLKVPGITSVSSSSQAFNILLPYIKEHEGGYDVPGSYFTGYLRKGGVNIADIWGFHVYLVGSNVLKGYIIFGTNGIVYNFWETKDRITGNGFPLDVS